MSLEKLYFDTRDENMEFEKNIDYIKGYYSNFWKKVHKNITMQYHKNALYFIKGSSFIDSLSIKFGYFHINKKLYTGKCSLLFPKEKKEYGFDVNSDQFCKFIIKTIDFVDRSFELAPKIDKDIFVYRMSTRDNLNNLKIGDRFLENNYSSTSLSPSYPISFYDPDKKYNNYFEILIPKGTYGIYFNINYTPEKGKDTNEYEFLLPRESTYQILKKKVFNFKTKKITKYTLLLISSEFKKNKINNINQTLNKKVSKKINKIKINYYQNIFLSLSCLILFEIITTLENIIDFHIKNTISNNQEFKKSKKKFITYQAVKVNKKFNIGQRYLLKKNTKTVRDITSLFNIMNIEGFYGNPFHNIHKTPKIILKFINQKGNLYYSENKTHSIYKLNLKVLLDKKNNYKVIKIENILDRYFNQIQLITLENI